MTLNTLLGLDLTPLQNNVASCLIMIVYYRMAMELAVSVRLRFDNSSDSRNILHMALSSTVMFWQLFDATDWSWRLNAILPAVMFVRFFYKGAIVRDPDDEDVRNMSRSSSPSELLFCPLQFAALMVWLGLCKFRTEEAAVLAAFGMGDGGLAPLIGSRYGRHIYRMPLSSHRTMEGSIVGVFMGTVAGCYLYLYLMGIRALPLRLVLAYGGIAAVVEGSCPTNVDCLAVAIVLHFSMAKVQDVLRA